jgi:hypothetical protein
MTDLTPQQYMAKYHWTVDHPQWLFLPEGMESCISRIIRYGQWCERQDYRERHMRGKIVTQVSMPSPEEMVEVVADDIRRLLTFGGDPPFYLYTGVPFDGEKFPMLRVIYNPKIIGFTVLQERFLGIEGV